MVKKLVISRLFLYKHRFIIGYALLGLAFVGLLLILPLVAQRGLSEAEMTSVVSSYGLGFDSPLNGDLVDLPYRVLQKVSVMIFGLTPYAIKLPSILVGLALGLLLILLLNRWFKNNVSLLASVLTVLSVPFLFLAGSGTPLIMIVFYPVLLLWLGSKIQGEKKPKPMYSFLFAVALLLAIFTPYMLYFAVFCVIFVCFQPHLRFIVKSLPRVPLIVMAVIILGGVGLLITNMISHPETISELLLAPGFDFGNFFGNVGTGLGLLFSWRGQSESVLLTPLTSLPMLALILIGLFSTTKGFFASRNSIASLLILFALVITGFNPEAAVFFMLPFAILAAHGLKYLLEKWYGLFPENPYARVAAILPLTILFGTMLIPSWLQYLNGYRYNPGVVRNFSYDLAIIRENLDGEVLVAPENYEFYRILEGSANVTVVENLEEAAGATRLAVLGEASVDKKFQLERIVTSPMRENSDIIYIYTEKGE